MRRHGKDLALDVAVWIIAFSPIALIIFWIISLLRP